MIAQLLPTARIPCTLATRANASNVGADENYFHATRNNESDRLFSHFPPSNQTKPNQIRTQT